MERTIINVREICLLQYFLHDPFHEKESNKNLIKCENKS